ncbi:transposase [Anaerocolumna aminovalerica]|uniref:transposase n=1 Tax=Anaerocolumna aminovalerica TaxID=1527 RepID=UPI000BE2A2AB
MVLVYKYGHEKFNTIKCFIKVCVKQCPRSTHYSEEFKQQIVDLYNSGSSVSYLSSEYGVTNVTIYSWIK